VRVSTDRQKRAATIETQRERIKGYIRQVGIPAEKVQEFADDGTTSRKPFHLRPGSADLLAQAQKGRVQEILVYAINRLGRDGDSTDTQTALRKLWKLGVRRIISMTQGEFLDNPHGRFMLDIHSAQGGYERDTNAERCIEGSRRLARESNQCLGGRPAFGFRQEGQRRQSVKVVATDLIPGVDLSEAEVVRRMYQQFDKYNRSDRRDPFDHIAKYVSALGVPGEWDGQKIKKMLRNEAYMGVSYYGTRKTVWDESGVSHMKPVPRDQWTERPAGSYPAIVSAELWKRVNARMDALTRDRKSHRKRDYPLAGLVRCETCGRAYVGAIGYYRCSSHYGKLRKTAKCASPGLRSQHLDDSVREYVGQFLARPGLAIEELRRQMEAEGLKGRTVADEIRLLDKRREELAEARRRVLTQFRKGIFSDDDVQREVGRVDAELAVLDQEREAKSKVSADAETVALELDWAGRLLGDLRGQLLDGKLSPEKKRKFIEALVAGVVITPDGKARVKFRFDSDFERARKWVRSGARAAVSEQLYAAAYSPSLTLEKVIVFPGNPRASRTRPAVPPAAKGSAKVRERRRA
jgi:site-specific DNA recombinase